MYAESTFQKIGAEAERKISKLQCHHVALLLQGCATVHFHSPSLVSKSVNAVKTMLDKFDLGDLAILVWALARLRYNSQPVWQKLESAAEKKLNNDVDALAKLSLGLARAGRVSSPVLLSAVTSAVVALSKSTILASPEQIASLVEAVGALENTPDSLWLDMMQLATAAMHGFVPAQLSQMAQFFATAPQSQQRTKMADILAIQAQKLECCFEARDLARLQHAICMMEPTKSLSYTCVTQLFSSQFDRHADSFS